MQRLFYICDETHCQNATDRSACDDACDDEMVFLWSTHEDVCKTRELKVKVENKHLFTSW